MCMWLQDRTVRESDDFIGFGFKYATDFCCYSWITNSDKRTLNFSAATAVFNVAVFIPVAYKQCFICNLRACNYLMYFIFHPEMGH
jgi:hypothetical protein